MTASQALGQDGSINTTQNPQLNKAITRKQSLTVCRVVAHSRSPSDHGKGASQNVVGEGKTVIWSVVWSVLWSGKRRKAVDCEAGCRSGGAQGGPAPHKNYSPRFSSSVYFLSLFRFAFGTMELPVPHPNLPEGAVAAAEISRGVARVSPAG